MDKKKSMQLELFGKRLMVCLVYLLLCVNTYILHAVLLLLLCAIWCSRQIMKSCYFFFCETIYCNLDWFSKKRKIHHFMKLHSLVIIFFCFVYNATQLTLQTYKFHFQMVQDHHSMVVSIRLPSFALCEIMSQVSHIALNQMIKLGALIAHWSIKYQVEIAPRPSTYLNIISSFS